MKNNRGQFMALYIPLVTVFMCVLVAGMYWVQNTSLDSHMVSPVKVLEIGDAKDVFEMVEKKWVCLANKNSEDNNGLKIEFCKLFAKADESDFIFDYFVDENGNSKGAFFNSDTERENFCNGNYEIKKEEEKVGIKLNNVKMATRLEAKDRDVINFVVDFSYDYAGERIIKLGEVSC